MKLVCIFQEGSKPSLSKAVQEISREHVPEGASFTAYFLAIEYKPAPDKSAKHCWHIFFKLDVQGVFQAPKEK